MTWLHGVKAYSAHSLGGLATGLGPPQRAGPAGLRRGHGHGRRRRRRRVRRRCVRRRRRVEGDRIRRAALAGAVLPVAGDAGEVHAQAGPQRLLGLPPHPLHCSLHLHGTLAAADSTRLLLEEDCEGDGARGKAVLKGKGSRHWRAVAAVGWAGVAAGCGLLV